MKTVYFPFRFEKSADLRAPAEAVFVHLDDFEQLGAHMMRSTWMMAGSRMRYEFDQAHGRKLNSHVRLLGSFLGIKLHIEERVIERAPPVRKAWQTIGSPRMLIFDAYRMGFLLLPRERGCTLRVFIDYALPQTGLTGWLGSIAGGLYARWCVNSIVIAALRRFA